ncbi:unnamed protein product [Chrysoparadoxa australica]
MSFDPLLFAPVILLSPFLLLVLARRFCPEHAARNPAAWEPSSPNTPQNAGLPESALKKLTRFTFTKKEQHNTDLEEPLSPSFQESRSAGGKEGNYLTDACSVCLDDYDEGDACMKLPCGHVFHQDCIATWFRGSHCCPYCQVEVDKLLDLKRVVPDESIEGLHSIMGAGTSLATLVEEEMRWRRTDSEMARSSRATTASRAPLEQEQEQV